MSYLGIDAGDVREYGPGKFTLVMDSAVYGASLDGGPDEETSREGWGWAGIMRGGSDILAHIESLGFEPLNEAESDILRESAGLILQESDNGFVTVAYFSDAEDMERQWSDIVERQWSDIVGYDGDEW